MDASNFESFGLSFEEKLGHTILVDPMFANQIHEVLDFDFFTVKHVKETVRAIYDYKKGQKQNPSLEVLGTVLSTRNDRWNDTERDLITSYFNSLGRELKEDIKNYHKELSLEFCRTQSLKEALLQIVKNLQAGKGHSNAVKLVKEATSLGADNNYGLNFFESLDTIGDRSSRFIIPTPWAELNQKVGGGHGKGELGIVFSTSGGGKSLSLVALAATAIEQGFNVIYYTMELSESVIQTRHAARLFQCRMDEVRYERPRILEMAPAFKGKLIVKKFPRRSATLTGMINHFERVKESCFIPDMVIIDPPDVMKFSTGKEGSYYHEQSDLYYDLRDWFEEVDVAGWVASQVNRSGYKAEYLEHEHASGSMGKVDASDLCISLRRPRESKIKNEGEMLIVKSRNGGEGSLYEMSIEPINMKMEVIREKLTDAPQSASGPVGIDKIRPKWEEAKNRWVKNNKPTNS
jgi:replicative DNA helicase